MRTAVITLAASRSLYVESGGGMVAAIEIISPSNKDRPSERLAATTRFAAYMHNGVHSSIVDVLSRPRGFSFADSLAEEFSIPDEPSIPAPMAASYFVGPGGLSGECWLGIRTQKLTAGEMLPTLPLWLTQDLVVPLHLEWTYAKAAAAAYLE